MPLSLICFTLAVSGATVCTEHEYRLQRQPGFRPGDLFSDTAFSSGGVIKRPTAGSTYAERYIKISGNTLTAAGVLKLRATQIVRTI